MARLVKELTLEEYIDCVIASGEKNFEDYCKKNNIDYNDAIEYN